MSYSFVLSSFNLTLLSHIHEWMSITDASIFLVLLKLLEVSGRILCTYMYKIRDDLEWRKEVQLCEIRTQNNK